MKKSVAAYLVFALGLVLSSTLMIADAKAQVFTRILSLRDLTFQLTTPESISHFLWQNFTFEKDQRLFGKEEYWQTPEEFLALQKGDCEDFAILAKELLRAAGIQAFLMNIYGDGFAHTVTVFKENGKYQVIDGSKLRRLDAEDLKEVSEKIHPFWKTSSIVDISAEHRTGRVLKTFTA